MKKIIVIPARLESKRLYGKSVMLAGGKTLLEWTYARATQSDADQVVVATDSSFIEQHCQAKGMDVVGTSVHHTNGTHRCADAIKQICNEPAIVVNLQVDEPLVDPAWLDSLVSMTRQTEIDIGTLVAIDHCSPEMMSDPNQVKVVCSYGRCHWFSRAPLIASQPHIGVYSYKSETLLKIADLKPSFYSTEESLEQLNWIECGFDITPYYVGKLPLSINTQSDFDKFKGMVEQ